MTIFRRSPDSSQVRAARSTQPVHASTSAVGLRPWYWIRIFSRLRILSETKAAVWVRAYAWVLTHLRRFADSKRPKRLISLGATPKGLHYRVAWGRGFWVVIFGGGWAGNSSLSWSSSSLWSGSGSVWRVSTNSRPSVVGTRTSII